jgi:hypothetical protein
MTANDNISILLGRSKLVPNVDSLYMLLFGIYRLF